MLHATGNQHVDHAVLMEAIKVLAPLFVAAESTAATTAD